MKKLAPLVVLLALLLCACGGKTVQGYTTADAETLLNTEGLFDGQLAPVDGAVAAGLYGLKEDTVQECAVYLATNTSVSADELAVLVLADETAAREAEAALQKRVESQIRVCESYCPAAVPRLEKAVISRLGSTVLLAVGDPDKLPAAVEKLH